MNINLNDFQKLQSRVATLERQNRRFKKIGLAMFIVIATLMFTAQIQSKKTVEANDNGNVRASLSMNETHNPEMLFLDEKGKNRIKLEGQNGPIVAGVISVFDNQGELRGILGGGGTTGRIALFDSKGISSRTTLAAGDLWIDGGIRLEDQEGFSAWLGKTGLLSKGETHTRSAASIALVNNNQGKILWQAP